MPAFPGKVATFPSADTHHAGRDSHFFPVTQVFVFNFVDKIVNVPALPGKAAALPLADTFLRVAILTFSLHPNPLCYVFFVGT